MSYQIKEIFYTLQGEGAHAGRAAVLCRFSGCNLWSGRENDRKSALCTFCDTDFRGTNGHQGSRYPGTSELVCAIRQLWPGHTGGKPYVVMTGGEPALQLDQNLIHALHQQNFEVGIETNGTLPLQAQPDWICVSPKSDTPLAISSGDELKLVYPQHEAPPEKFEHLSFDHFYLQPMDNAHLKDNIQAAARYCLEHPQWQLSLQTHKIIGLP